MWRILTLGKETFVAFVPPKGIWGGLWQVPAPFSEQLGWTYAQYHSYWTGVAEIVGSLALILNTLGVIDLGGVPAASLFLLTLTVTPANIYMFTHNPDVPNIPPVTYPWGHFGRGILQCALLAIFFQSGRASSKWTMSSCFGQCQYGCHIKQYLYQLQNQQQRQQNAYGLHNVDLGQAATTARGESYHKKRE